MKEDEVGSKSYRRDRSAVVLKVWSRGTPAKLQDWFKGSADRNYSHKKIGRHYLLLLFLFSHECAVEFKCRVLYQAKQ